MTCLSSGEGGRPIRLSEITKFICIGAHCDDVEGRMGGLFARLSSQGARGTYVVMVENAFVAEASGIADTETALATRRAESRRGAAELGAARVEFLAFKSYYLSAPDRRQVIPAFRSREETAAMAADIYWYGLPPVQNAYLFPECVERLTSLIHEEQPELVITHTANDRHPDHYAVARFTDLVVTDVNASGAGIRLLLREPGGGGPMGGWRPMVLVELSEEHLTMKERALECFPSQHPNGMHGFARRLAEQYGKLGGVPLAEAYTIGGGAEGGSWGTDEGFAEGLAMANAPMRVLRLNEGGGPKDDR